MSDDPMLLFEVDAERKKVRALQAELDALRAFKASVPWNTLQMAVSLSFMAPIPAPPDDPRLTASIWLEQNTPKEAAQ